MTSIPCQLDEEFLSMVTPMGSDHAQFLLYAIRGANAMPLMPPSLHNWPCESTVDSFTLCDVGWPCSVDLFEISTHHLSEGYELDLLNPLIDLTAQHAAVSWYMFDGVFGDIQTLFADWQAEQVYGVSISNYSVQLATSYAQRLHRQWKDLINAASQRITTEYPTLGNLIIP